MDRPEKTPEENTDDEVENVRGTIYNEETLWFLHQERFTSTNMDSQQNTPVEHSDDEEENVQGTIYNEEILVLVFVASVLVLILQHLTKTSMCSKGLIGQHTPSSTRHEELVNKPSST